MLALLLFSATAGAGAEDVRIDVLSNRADLISGGDALVAVAVPQGADASRLRVTVGERDVTSAFAVRADGRYFGRIEGLALGDNLVTARLPDGRGARITITNHPSGGPVFSGPQVQPWSCNSGATDALCTRTPSYQYFYVPAGIDPQASPGLIGAPGAPDAYFLAYDPANPPPATVIAQTTTDQGHTVPFIVRQETGSVDRGQFQIAVLYDPSKPWDVGHPQTGWNRKLFLVGGAGCGISYQEGAAPGVLYGKVLARGFATMSTALEATGTNCNLVLQAESLMMAKEHFIEAYGPVRYTLSIGGSGASIVQHWNANAYPGIYDGLIVEASFPDAWTPVENTEDCISLVNYWTDPTRWAPGVAWSPADQSFVADGSAASSCAAWAAAFTGLFTPADETGQIPAGDVYDPQTNPNGVRGTLWDYSVAQLGRRPPEAWGPVESGIGQGFANRPIDTVGIQYGLKALMNGQITPAQFVDLNAKAGGHDIDYNVQPQRTLADPAALTVVYRSGYLNQANNLHVPIIDIRGTSNVEIHDTYHSWSMRARLERANGNHDNQIIWNSFTASGFVIDQALESQAFDLMDRWLSAIEADASDRPLAEKVRSSKPVDAVDRCTVPGTGIAGPCVIPQSGSPRLGAGQPLTNDIAKCQLKAMNRTDYFPNLFTDAQWSQLQQAFPTGVCDYTKAGVNQQATVPWMTYKDGPGGQPLGDAPRSEPFHTAPDLAASSLALSRQRVQGGDQVSFRAVAANLGNADAAGVVVRFLVDGVQLGADQTIAHLAASASVSVSSAVWSAKHQQGAHTVQVVLDPANVIAELSEFNNSASASFIVEGNKVRNGSFEQSSNGASPDAWTSSGSTAYENGGTDGQRSVSAQPGGSWSTEPVAVVPGTSYLASVQLSGGGGTLVIQQLAADGTVLALNSQALPVTTVFETIGITVGIIPGAAQLRLVLLGGPLGKTTFDNVQLIGG